MKRFILFTLAVLGWVGLITNYEKIKILYIVVVTLVGIAAEGYARAFKFESTPGFIGTFVLEVTIDIGVFWMVWVYGFGFVTAVWGFIAAHIENAPAIPDNAKMAVSIVCECVAALESFLTTKKQP